MAKVSNIIQGAFNANARGYGFVVNEDNKPDIFIPADKVNGALHLDIVEVKIKNGKHTRPEGAITRIISRGFPLLAGTFCAHEKYIVPLEPKVPYGFPVTTAAIKKLKLVDGHRVMFSCSVEGQIKVEEVFGHKNDPGMDVLSMVRQYGVPYKFPSAVIKDANALPDTVMEDDVKGREDYRDWDIFTIDGADTKDIDDAISLKILPNKNYELGVHIADVSHYVKPASKLDKEARARGTSIYLADRVIPMLPHVLSNGICSLNPDVDRLTLSCIMEINKKGEVVSNRLAESVIRSNRKYTYDEVAKMIDTKKFTGNFKQMHALAKILHKKRVLRGALEFTPIEAKIVVDDAGMPVDIVPRKPNSATSLIEEFMIVCNETVAEHIKESGSESFVYRTHDRPDNEKMFQLAAYAKDLGYTMPVSEKGVSPKTLQKLLDHADPTLEPFILRSMKQARYTMENIGHFGLASRCYCHFTSPIRRYPDLLVHRSIKGILKKRGLADLCVHCSVTERNAESLERDVLQLKKAQFMMDKVGQEFEGVVSGVTAWGIFVQLPNTVEGLVPMNELTNDYYEFVEKQMALYGRRKKKRIRLGDTFKIRVSSVNEEDSRITFLPIF